MLRWFEIIVLTFTICNATGQSFYNPINVNPIPPNPTVATLGKYGEIPVSLNTGTANIEIPIYKISRGRISFPLTLSYHSAGIKVNETASRFGLGWALQGIPAITRLQRGLPDEFPNGFKYRGNDVLRFKNGELSTAEYTQFLKNIEDGVWDSEADIFSYTLGNESGKFFFSNDGKIYTIPRSKLIIEDHNGGWIITNTDGVKYFFDKVENTTVTPYANSNNVISVYNPKETITQWYPSRIVDNSQNSVTFEYEQIAYENFSVDENSIQLVYDYTTGFQTACADMDGTRTENFSWSLIITPRLKSINFGLGMVGFNYNMNLHLDENSYTENAINEIWIGESELNKNSNYKFYFDYFNCKNGSKKIKLDSLTTYSNGEVGGVYKFKYNNEQLPGSFTYSQDYWGYYNGKANGEILTYRYKNGAVRGADKSVDEQMAKAGILERIVYPTGGYTEFDHELNDYQTIMPLHYEKLSQIIQLSGSNDGSTVVNPTFFSVFEVKTSDLNSEGECPVRVDISTNCQNSMVICMHQFSIIYPNGLERTITNADTVINLLPGIYQAKAIIETEFAGSPLASFNLVLWKLQKNKPGIYTKKGGGLRIKRILNNDLVSGLASEKEFQYKSNLDSNSSGILSVFPKFETDNTYYRVMQMVGNDNIPYGCKCKTFSSVSNAPYSVTNGSFITYKNVIEKIKSGDSTQYISYRFSGYDEYPDEIYTDFPFPPNVSLEWKRGQKLNERFYLGNISAGKILNAKIYDYYFGNDPLDTLQRRSYSVKFGRDVFENLPLSGRNLKTVVYSTKTEFFGLKKETEINYLPGTGLDSLVASRTFKYSDKHYKIIEQEGSNSKGQLEKTQFYYTPDFIYGLPLENQQINSSLANSNDLALVQVKKFIGSIELETTRNDYGYFGQRVFPKVLLRKERNDIPFSKVEFKRYDSYGNLVEFLDEKKQNTVIIYGYKGTYPVLKVLGSNYDYVSQQLNLALLDSLSTTESVLKNELEAFRVSLPQGILASYFIYKPLIGIKSQTETNGRSTYYEYDPLNRLKLIKDPYYNILKQFCYNYAGQPINCFDQIFSNSTQTLNFTRENCGPGFSGGTVAFTAQQGMFTSTISPQDANNKAIAYLNANGVAYANANGICTPLISCTPSVCQALGQDYKCMGSDCERGFQIFTGEEIMVNGVPHCEFYYEWSDFSRLYGSIASGGGACLPTF